MLQSLLCRIKYGLVFFAAILSSAVFAYQADVSDISRSYLRSVIKAVREARQSIDVVMYLVSLSPGDVDTAVYRLINELIKAHKRGLVVTVILDQNYGLDDKNILCFKVLKDAGITVFYDDPRIITHSKVIVVDSEIVIIGSANWTESAVRRNYETNILVKSKKIAEILLEDFSKIQKNKNHYKKIEPPAYLVPLSWIFLEDPKLAGKMINRHDERAFDIYLLLLKEFKSGPITLDYEKMAESLSISKVMDRTAYRRQIIKVLKKLESEYMLIELKQKYAKDALITLLDYKDKTKKYNYPKDWYFYLSSEYREYGWDRRLSLRAKFCYLINLAYLSISDIKPWWYAAIRVLSKRFNVSPYIISKGMTELRRWNIIDVQYGALSKDNIKSRMAKSYKLLGFYNPIILDKQWKEMELRYGIDKLKKARGYASIVYKENTPEVVKDIIIAIDTMGEEKVKKAFDIVSQKNPDNPKRCWRYVKGILRNLTYASIIFR